MNYIVIINVKIKMKIIKVMTRIIKVKPFYGTYRVRRFVILNDFSPFSRFHRLSWKDFLGPTRRCWTRLSSACHTRGQVRRRWRTSCLTRTSRPPARQTWRRSWRNEWRHTSRSRPACGLSNRYRRARLARYCGEYSRTSTKKPKAPSDHRKSRGVTISAINNDVPKIILS